MSSAAPVAFHPPLAHVSCGSGPALLLLQGVGLAGGAWRPQVEALQSEFQVVCVDNPGVGNSAAQDVRSSLEAIAQGALAVCDALSLSHFHVLGHSMGGLIAQALALAAPERVASLALLCTFPHGADGARLKRGLLWPSIRARCGSRSARRRAFLEIIFPPAYLAAADVPALAARVGEIFGRDLADSPPGMFAQLAAMKRFDVSPELQRLTSIRTLVLSAEQDLIAPPRSGKALAALIPGSHYLEIPAAGHAVTLQLPEVINPLLREHLLR
jgi:pimeloyl-ACP methyl ester carboxylesterase